MPKEIKLLLVIIGLIVVGIGSYEFYKLAYNYYWRTKKVVEITYPTPPSDWQSYQSDYGYQISFPQGWLKNQLPSGQEVDLISPQAQADPEACMTEEKGCSPFVEISTYNTLESLKRSFVNFDYPGSDLASALESLTKDVHYEDISTGNYLYSTVYKTNLAGQTSYVLTESTINAAQDAQKTVFVIENQGMFYKLKLRNAGAFTNMTADNQGIIGSLKLIEPLKTVIEEPAITVKNWMDYQNESLKFYLKIPDDWLVDQKIDQVIFTDPIQLQVADFYTYKYHEVAFIGETFHLTLYDKMGDLLSAASTLSQTELEQEEDLSLEEYLKKYKGQSDIVDYRKVTINNNNGFEVERSGFAGYTGYLFEKNSQIYEIFFGHAWDPSELTAIEKEILNSFRMN